jgi:hypothetical protein
LRGSSADWIAHAFGCFDLPFAVCRIRLDGPAYDPAPGGRRVALVLRAKDEMPFIARIWQPPPAMVSGREQAGDAEMEAAWLQRDRWNPAIG